MDDFDYVIRLLRCIEDDLEKLHLRLQALEQNTTTARPAEQKPDKFGCLPPITPPIRCPLEWWIFEDDCYRTIAGASKAQAEAKFLFGRASPITHVREVL